MDRTLLTDLRTFAEDQVRADPRGVIRFCVKYADGARKGQFWVFGDEQMATGEGRLAGKLWWNDQSRCRRLRGLRQMRSIGNEADMACAGTIDRLDAGDLQSLIATNFCVYLSSQLRKLHK